MVQFSAVPLMTYTPSSVISIVLLSETAILCDSLVSAVCSRSRSVKISSDDVLYESSAIFSVMISFDVSAFVLSVDVIFPQPAIEARITADTIIDVK